jgi:3-phenylpropionate/trans-cinnamate dioxygenase ferredoxin reductase subunit
VSAPTVAIVGANLAGGHVAHALRREGFDGRVVLIGAEPHLPYERPPLSKDVLIGTAEPSSTQVWPEAAYVDAAIEPVLGTRVTRIDPAARRVELATGASLTADHVVLCTGSHPRPVPVGRRLAGMHDLRTLDDALALRAELRAGCRLVVVGAGFIGAEVAAAGIALGCDVTMIELAALPLQRVLGAEVGRLYAALHAARGVDLHLGVGVASIEGDDRCRAVVLSDGSRIETDLVVFGVGVVPAAELAEAAGIVVGNGIVVDHACRTSIPEVLAAGDVTCRPTSFAPGPIRLETWQNAQNQAIAAAKTIAGTEVRFDDVPWFWSDQYDVNLQVAGIPQPHHDVVWRGSGEGMDGVAFYLDGEVVAAAVGLNRPRDVRAAMSLVQQHRQVRRADLSDESVDLRRLPSAP